MCAIMFLRRSGIRTIERLAPTRCHGLSSLLDHDSRPCSRSFRYKFRSLIPRILAAFPR